jgi:hypothetical protein
MATASGRTLLILMVVGGEGWLPYIFVFVFCNIFVTGFPVKFGLLSLGRARQRRCRAYPGHWGNRTLLMVEETGVPGGNEETTGTWPAPKIPLYGATCLVPRAGIEPTPCTDIGYRPVSRARQTRREPLGHHVPQGNQNVSVRAFII